MKFKESLNKLKEGIVNGWKRLGSEDIEQEVEVVYPADTVERLNALGTVVNYKANLKAKLQEPKNSIRQSPSRYGNGRTIMPENGENSKGIDHGDRVR